LSSFFFQAEDGIRDFHVTGVQTCALPICTPPATASEPVGTNAPVVALTKTSATGLSSPTSETVIVARTPAEPAPQPESSPEAARSEERRVGKKGRARAAPDPEAKKRVKRR